MNRTYELTIKDYPNASSSVVDNNKALVLRQFMEMLEDKLDEIEEYTDKELKEQFSISYTFAINVKISDDEDDER